MSARAFKARWRAGHRIGHAFGYFIAPGLVLLVSAAFVAWAVWRATQ